MPNVSDSEKSVKTWIWILTVQNTTLPPRASVLVYMSCRIPFHSASALARFPVTEHRAPAALPEPPCLRPRRSAFWRINARIRCRSLFPYFQQRFKWSIRGFYTESCSALTKVSSRTPVCSITACVCGCLLVYAENRREFSFSNEWLRSIAIRCVINASLFL